MYLYYSQDGPKQTLEAQIAIGVELWAAKYGAGALPAEIHVPPGLIAEAGRWAPACREEWRRLGPGRMVALGPVTPTVVQAEMALGRS